MSVKFRSFNADPTLRFQKFLRDSEKLLSMDLDKPGKISRCIEEYDANILVVLCQVAMPGNCAFIHSFVKIQRYFIDLGKIMLSFTQCVSTFRLSAWLDSINGWIPVK